MKRINPRLLMVIVAVLTVVFVVLIFDWAISALVHHRAEVMVPSITGKSVVAALDSLYKYNLGLKKEGQEYHPDLPSGTVTRQDPPGGMIVREGKLIKVTISQGSEMVYVPDVVGETVRNAELVIRKASLNVGERKEMYSLKYEKEKVMSQNPEPNSITKKSDSVGLVVSLGIPSGGIILMPALVGKNVNEAKIWCEQNNVTYEINEDNQSAPPGTVVSQSPVPDEVISGTAAVRLVVSAYGENRTERRSFGESVHYEVPQGAREQKVRMVLIDGDGERDIYSNIQAPGSKIDLVVPKKGNAKLRIFINNILVEEKEL